MRWRGSKELLICQAHRGQDLCQDNEGMLIRILGCCNDPPIVKSEQLFGGLVENPT